MYHYVREDSINAPYSKHKKLDDFIKEISFMKRNHNFLNVTEAINQKNYSENKNSIILTFDDGLKDHLNVAEILKKHNINATFYIPIQPHLNQELLHVHKAHLITSTYGEESLLLLGKALDTLNIDKFSLENKDEKDLFKNRYINHSDRDGIKDFKKIINYYGCIGLRDLILNQILKSKNIKSDFESYYLNKKEIKYISSLGFEIGSHGVSHNVMSRLSKKEQYYEINESKTFLEKIIRKKITSFCYPFGRKNSYNSDTIELLNKAKYQNAISVDSRDIILEDIMKNIYEIPRYDCNEIERVLYVQ